jgi:lipoprotein-anchoring transpeptidase ErfK/SrfK
MRSALVVLLLAAAGLLATDLRSSAEPSRAEAALPRRLAEVRAAPDTVRVPFLRDGRLVRAERVVPSGVTPERYALRELFQGPTRAERRNGLRTAIPDGARVRSLEADAGVWRVSVSRSTFVSGTRETKRRRLWQIAATLAPLGSEEYLSLATEGRFVTTQRIGVQPGTWSSVLGEKDYLYSVRGVQVRLWQLGYLDRASVTGSVDYLTEQALQAFQGWERLGRTGTVTGETQLALFTAERPRAAQRDQGRHVEIDRDRGVLLTVEDGQVVRAVHTSTGAGGLATPTGDFHVYTKSLYSWSVPFHVWMPFAAYFNGGIALHQSPDVPPYPASHGCVRLPAGEAERVYGFVDIGTPVYVR